MRAACAHNVLLVNQISCASREESKQARTYDSCILLYILFQTHLCDACVYMSVYGPHSRKERNRENELYAVWTSIESWNK